MDRFFSIYKDFFNLFYPPLCAACNCVLLKQEKYICTSCLYYLPETNFHMEKNNSMTQLFWGRVLIEEASAMYYFEKGSKCRKILHQIKYKNNPGLAFYLGNIYGRELLLKRKYINADILIPVPLHLTRQKQRGFNQSEWFARGLADSLEKEVLTGLLVRFLGSGTQTNKSRIERWENVKNNFKVKFPEKIENKHILLVDDIVTTGATLESCASVLLKNNGVKVSIVTLAFA